MDALKRFFLCRLLGRHDFFRVHRYSKDISKVGCRRCWRFWGMHGGVEAFVPWDTELQDIEELMKETR